MASEKLSNYLCPGIKNIKLKSLKLINCMKNNESYPTIKDFVMQQAHEKGF